MIKNLRLLLFILFTGFTLFNYGQSENEFAKEVSNVVLRNDSLWNPALKTIVFTGSSSVRMWKNLQETFPNHQILNTGFGGSQAADLLIFLDDLVLNYNPAKVFIYEGDNDLWDKKSPNKIINTTVEIINKIHKKNKNTQVVLISSKPSISRWKIRGKYRRLNKKMKSLSDNSDKIEFVDVWYPMLNGKKLKTNLFIEDGLHMNQTGYDIWYDAMKNLVNQP